MIEAKNWIFNLLNIQSRSGKEHLKKQVELIALPPVEVNVLAEAMLVEDEGMSIGRSNIYPVVVKESGSRGKDLKEFIAIVDHSLYSYQLLQLFNRFVPVKRDLMNEPDEWLTNVVIDWAYMAAQSRADRSFRKKLEKVHAKVPGFKEFMSHAEVFIDAAGLQDLSVQYEIPIQNRKIVPTLHVDMKNGKPVWCDKVFDDEFSAQLLDAVSPYINRQKDTGWSDGTMVHDTFAGMAIPPYIHPETTTHWEPEQFGQPMSIAQGPVHNWQHRNEHWNAPFMKNLESYIESEVKKL